jgi:hypothetical protein
LISGALITGEENHLVCRGGRSEEFQCAVSAVIVEVHQRVIAQNRKGDTSTVAITPDECDPQGEIEKGTSAVGQLRILEPCDVVPTLDEYLAALISAEEQASPPWDDFLNETLGLLDQGILIVALVLVDDPREN